MKKKLTVLVLALVFALSLTLAACAHTHTFSEDWAHDQTHHWHTATCEHTDEISDKEEHDFGTNGICKCGFRKDEVEKSNGDFTWNLYVGDEPCTLPLVPEGKAEKDSIQIHYKREKSSEYTAWTLWLWTTSGTVGSSTSGAGWKFNYQDEFGAVALYSLEDLGKLQGGTGGFTGDEPLGFIVRNASWGKDVDADRFWTLGDKDENNYYHLYLLQGDSKLYTSKPEGQDNLKYNANAAFRSEKQIAITTATPVRHVKIYEGTTLLGETDTDETAKIRYNMPGSKKADLNKEYKVELTFADGKTVNDIGVSIIALYDTEDFGTIYNYDGKLGADYSATSTTFRVWSPVSTQITLNLYDEGTDSEATKTVPMTKGEKGVWETTVNGNLAKQYYTYTVVNSSYPEGREIVDPYAKSAGLNGLRGQIVNFDDPELTPDGWDQVKPIAYDKNELVVWETHVADVTSSNTWNGPETYRKKFLGMIESGTTYTKGDQTVKTGFDHIKELGVNAVQLVPIFDQANDESNVKFNWGYNPLNYNVLEGAYSTDATDGYVRIKEFRQLVQAFNGANINIIMDVVYNHMSAAIGSNFDVLMPGYYFRYTAADDLANGSGCGNETASNHYMFRKFMIDSVTFWAETYKLGGFRFDLMGLHDLETMNQLTAALQKINPNVVVYGEPWEAGTTPLPTDQHADQANGNKFVGFGQFNDQMRDALIKGGLNAASATGWVTGVTPNSSDVENILSGMLGHTGVGANAINDITKTVNYVTCHDNYTLWDRIWATGELKKSKPNDVIEARQQAVLANSVVLTSNGISFVLAGEEFLRSKEENGAKGDEIHNSYESSYKVNELDYSRKIEYSNEFAIYKKLVEFKTKHLGLKASEVTSQNYKVEAAANNTVIIATVTSSDGTQWKIIHGHYSIAKDYSVNLQGYTVYLDTLNLQASGTELTSSTPISKYQTLIAKKAA